MYTTPAARKSFIETAVKILRTSSVKHSFDWMLSFNFYKEEMETVVNEIRDMHPFAAKKLQGMIDGHEFFVTETSETTYKEMKSI